MICDHDCLRCRFADCILDEEHDIELTADEILESERLDVEAFRVNCEADYSGEEARRKRVRDTKRRYRLYHRQEIMEYEARRRLENREEIQARNKRYYEENREKILARRKELRRANRNAGKRRKTTNKTNTGK